MSDRGSRYIFELQFIKLVKCVHGCPLGFQKRHKPLTVNNIFLSCPLAWTQQCFFHQHVTWKGSRVARTCDRSLLTAIKKN